MKRGRSFRVEEVLDVFQVYEDTAMGLICVLYDSSARDENASRVEYLNFLIVFV
jgi:hypothetical protein